VRAGVLAVQGASELHLEALERLRADGLNVEGRGVRRPRDLEDLDVLIIPGGESTTISMMLESTGLADPVGELLEAGIPTLGTCAGMILLAAEISDGRPDQRCYGAIDITTRRNAWGRQVESFETALEVPLLGPEPVPAVFIRAPGVERVGDAVEVLATHAGQAVMCRQGNVMVTAFHPELSEDLRIHRLFIESATPVPTSREDL